MSKRLVAAVIALVLVGAGGLVLIGFDEPANINVSRQNPSLDPYRDTSLTDCSEVAANFERGLDWEYVGEPSEGLTVCQDIELLR